MIVISPSASRMRYESCSHLTRAKKRAVPIRPRAIMVHMTEWDLTRWDSWGLVMEHAGRWSAEMGLMRRDPKCHQVSCKKLDSCPSITLCFVFPRALFPALTVPYCLLCLL